jgi:hypothetical protein
MCVEELEQFMDKLRDDMERWLQLPLPGSQGARELERFSRREAVETAHSQAGLAVVSAGDHMFALLRTLREPVQSFAPWTIARAVLESSAIAMWLSDVNIDARRRVARSCCIRLADNDEQRAFVRGVNMGSAEVTKLETRRTEIFESIKAGGLHVKRSKKGKFVGIDGERFPGPTQLIAQQLDREWLYRISSGVAHSYAWSSLHVGMRRTAADSSMVTQHLDPTLGWLLLGSAAEAFARGVDHRYRLFGWERANWVAMLEHTWSRIGVDAESRFWRPDPGSD